MGQKIDVKHQYFFNVKYFQSCLTGNSQKKCEKDNEEKWDDKIGVESHADTKQVK